MRKAEGGLPEKKAHTALLVAVWDYYRQDNMIRAKDPDNAPIVKALLEHGANLRLRDEEDNSPLLYSVWGKHLSTLRLLLEYGADPNDKAQNGTTVLIWGVCGQNPEVVRLLLAYGANPNARDKIGDCTLMCPGMEDGLYHVPVLTVLLEYGANVNQRDENGSTPLMIAAECDNAEMARCLLAHGADVRARNLDGETALSLAKRNGHTTLEIVGKC